MKRRKTAITAGEYTSEKNYWLNKLSGEWKKGCFPYDHKRTGANERELRQIAFSFRGALYAQLLKLSSGSDVNLHMILAAGLLALLYRYTCIGQDDDWQDITVAAPIYRQDIEAEFINSVLVLRNQTGLGLAFKDLLLQLRETIIEAEENLNYPLERIAEKLKIGTGEDSCPLFDIVILLENIHDKEYIRDTAPNMIFSFLRTEESLEGTVEYNGAVYRQSKH
jgi:non-ribosomal peptide synthetase component F